ncbi:uncharacterized protein METZ01_LOCUS40313 [marine metagenome]|uniref:Uncharacterized protein n=1 Tax=marine metagenome TaxID=408172 RepID=A0A381R9F0_9ZZZZ
MLALSIKIKSILSDNQPPLLKANSRFQITHSFPAQRVGKFHVFKPVVNQRNMHYSNPIHDKSGSQSTGPAINFTNSNYLFYS